MLKEEGGLKEEEVLDVRKSKFLALIGWGYQPL